MVFDLGRMVSDTISLYYSLSNANSLNWDYISHQLFQLYCRFLIFGEPSDCSLLSLITSVSDLTLRLDIYGFLGDSLVSRSENTDLGFYSWKMEWAQWV